MGEQTWGFDVEGINEAEGFEGPPVGHYTMEIADTLFKTNKNGDSYLSVVYTILDAEDSEWIGKKHYQYCDLSPERFQYSKKDFRRMGVPEASLTNDGGPQMMISTVFECDLTKNDKGYVNMRYIKPVTKAGEAVQATLPAETQPKPARAAVASRR